MIFYELWNDMWTTFPRWTIAITKLSINFIPSKKFFKIIALVEETAGGMQSRALFTRTYETKIKNWKISVNNLGPKYFENACSLSWKLFLIHILAQLNHW